jgi:Peptidase A4 family
MIRARAAAPLAVALVCAFGAPTATAGVWHGPGAFASDSATEVSTNWAGYAVAASATAAAKPFASVTGRWVQPAATCRSAEPTYSAFWLGLGGFARGSFAVEQAGTQANCAFGRPTYVAWYELFPAPPVNLKLRVRPGDLLSATVSVAKHTVVVRLRNVTTHKLFTKRLRMRRPDLSSAEWIAESPTGCDYLGNCTTLPLTNFGTVDFSRSSATVKGHKGRISDPVWSATAIELHGDLNDPEHPSQAGANAIPGALGPDGGSFTVSWQELTPPPSG